MTNEAGGLPERTGPPDGDASVLILCTVGGVGGATRVVGTLAARMRAFGVPPRLVFPDPASLDTIAAVQWLAAEGVAAESNDDLPAWYGSHGLRAMARLRGFVRKANGAATYLHYGSNQIAFRDVIAGVGARRGRCVVMVHHAAPISGWRPRVMTRSGAELAHEVVVSTPVMADLLTGIGGRLSKITVIRWGVPPRREAPSQREARARLSRPPGAFVVAAVARLDLGKNIPQLVRCVATLVRDGRFREDLYYRINVIEMRVPTLRERAEDVLPLVEQWHSGDLPNHGLALQAAPGIVEHYKQFAAREKGDGWAARLVVTWEANPYQSHKLFLPLLTVSPDS